MTVFSRSVVGPAGSGKTRLIFSMLVFRTFRPSFKKTFYFYKENQPLFKEMAKKLNIEFVPCLDFSMTKKLENCLLVFDDSCEEIYQEKKFVKFALAGRHKKFIAFSRNIIYIIRVSDRVPLTSIQRTSFCPSHHTTYNKLIT